MVKKTKLKASKDFVALIALKPLVAWLETQPPGREYDFSSCTECLLAQYAVDHGFGRVLVGGVSITQTPQHEDVPLPLALREVVYPRGGNTIAAAMARAQERGAGK